MSLPRQILPGSTYLVTRRCTERRFLLRPDPFVVRLFGYLLAVAAARYRVQTHAALCLSNHYHAIVTDPSGKLPRWLAWLHRLLAVVINVYRGRWEALWSSDKPSVVRLETSDDVLEKLCYVLLNAKSAGLVSTADDWPGFKTDPADLLRPDGVEFERPGLYFSPKGRMPATARLRLTKPPGFEDQTDEEFVQLLQERVAAREAEQQAQRGDEPLPVLDEHAILDADWNRAPKSPTPRRKLSPHIAARDRDVRCRAIERLQQFRADYDEARRRWTEGHRRTVFPAGTYWMRVAFSVRSHAPPQEP